MNPSSDNQSILTGATWPIVVGGIVSLAVAMGIGRFAFTPLLPLMLRDGIIDIATGTEWAAANYIGYLLGALSAARIFRKPLRGVQIGLAGIALTTLAIVLVDSKIATAGAILRGAAGIFSAWVLVCTSGWCLNELALRQATGQGSWIYTGVGLGITLAGVMTWLGGHQSATALWLELGIVACAGMALAMACMRNRPIVASAPKSAASLVNAGQDRRRSYALVACYSAFGFGYIIPATFLPTMAKQLTSDPRIFGLTWPIFGLAAALSVAAGARWLAAWPRARLWALAQASMALGTLLPLFVNSLWSIAVCAVLVGGTFMVATMAGLQLARETMPANPTLLLGRMTAGFAAGQIVGPLMIRAFGSGQIAGWDAISWANATATILLFATAAWLWRMSQSK
ncbi:putative MFS family arabinose efflux permease [Paucimonas lemoignei]|uniref:Putative MFS family arabinose efflux permease n=1 Tax=Paucimonas lemoignei TaxID=29443 RepID=A0A4R3HW94_PAULE|nr:YbfB/YjiJ family MFS transporter [Paucimonas lemoignei]TCS37378.1 putative MFS family arabinose efflux permease [Paucimonas lemoignei]